MHRKQWIFDMDGTLTDSMTVVWEGAPDALLRRYGRTARPGIHDVLLSMGMVEGAEYLIRTYDLPLPLRDYEPAMRQVIRDLYKKVELKPGVREMLARLMTAVTQEEWDIAMTRMLEASFPQFPRKKWTDAETKDTVLRLRRRAAEAVTELKTKVFLIGPLPQQPAPDGLIQRCFGIGGDVLRGPVPVEGMIAQKAV